MINRGKYNSVVHRMMSNEKAKLHAKWRTRQFRVNDFTATSTKLPVKRPLCDCVGNFVRLWNCGAQDTLARLRAGTAAVAAEVGVPEPV